MFYAEINCRCLPMGNMSGYILSFSFGDDDDDDDVCSKDDEDDDNDDGENCCCLLKGNMSLFIL